VKTCDIRGLQRGQQHLQLYRVTARHHGSEVIPTRGQQPRRGDHSRQRGVPQIKESSAPPRTMTVQVQNNSRRVAEGHRGQWVGLDLRTTHTATWQYSAKELQMLQELAEAGTFTRRSLLVIDVASRGVTRAVENTVAAWTAARPLCTHNIMRFVSLPPNRGH
jgi:hypothetical protein